MMYEKPEVTALGPAASMVQSCGKQNGPSDCNGAEGTTALPLPMKPTSNKMPGRPFQGALAHLT
jgi:hypothetical protein